jgi:hypothetical protein
MHKYQPYINLRRKDYLQTDFFDKKYSIDTQHPMIELDGVLRPGVIPLSQPNINYNGYMGTCFFEMDLINLFLKEYIKDLSLYSFIDVGSGKGKVLFYNIDQKMNYKKNIGIECDDKFIQIYKNNAKHFKESLFLYPYNALKYRSKNEPTIYFFFQPFTSQIYKKFINNNLTTMLNNKTILINICPYDEDNGEFPAQEIFKDFKLIYNNNYINIYQS